MSSEALLGSRVPQLSLRGRCEDRLRQTSRALRHWWEVTASCDYLASSKRRLFSKPIILLLTLATNVQMGLHAFDTVATLVMVAIPHRSLWFDVVAAVWNLYDCYQKYGYYPGLPLWLLMAMSWTHILGLHSFTMIPFLLTPLLNEKVFEHKCAGLDIQSFIAISTMLFVFGVAAEWQLADGYHQLQKSTDTTQLLLDQATNGLCTLSRESGSISDASSAFIESLGMTTEGATIFDHVCPEDCGKVADLLHDPGTVLPGPILATFFRGPTLTGAPAAQFEAKLVSFAVTEKGVRVCLQKVGEDRFAEAPAGQRRAAGAPGGEAISAPRSGIPLGPHPQHAQEAVSDRDADLGTETSFAVSRTTTSIRPPLTPHTKSVEVQTSPAEPSPRPPPMPGRAGVRWGRRATRQARVRLNTSRRQVPGFEETPWPTKIMLLMDSLESINACGRGCCMLHVSVGAARKALDIIDRKDCESVRFRSWQCPECLALIDREVANEGTAAMDLNTLEECEICGAEISPLPRSVSTPFGSTPNASDEGPLATPARVPCPGSSMFKITIDRSDGADLGIDVDLCYGSAVLVANVKEGLVQQWNDCNREAEVRTGDYLVAVNGLSGSPERIVAECGRRALLDIVVLRS